MSNPFSPYPKSKLAISPSSSSSSFEYSDSDEFREKIISIDFSAEFSDSCTSLKGKIKEFRKSIESNRTSLKSVSEKVESMNEYLKSIEERVVRKSLELGKIGESIFFCSTESEKDGRESQEGFEESGEKLRRIRERMKGRVLEAELNWIVKQKELAAYQEYLKNMKCAQELGINEQKLRLQIVKNRKEFVNGMKGKLNTEIECNSLYFFIDSGIGKLPNMTLQDLIEKLELKNKNLLLAELKFWHSTQIFQSMKMQIFQDFISQASKIRSFSTKRSIEHKLIINQKLEALNPSNQAPETLPNAEDSKKPRLLFTITYFQRHLSSLEKRITQKRKQHSRAQKKIRQKTVELTTIEQKLANIKTKLFTLCL